MGMTVLVFLGLCSYVPGDIEMTNALCQYRMEAKQRDIKPVGEGMDDFSHDAYSFLVC